MPTEISSVDAGVVRSCNASMVSPDGCACAMRPQGPPECGHTAAAGEGVRGSEGDVWQLVQWQQHMCLSQLHSSRHRVGISQQ